MARRGKYPPLVTKYWDHLVQMQGLIDAGATPNAAAAELARKCWTTMPSPTLSSCSAWFKRNQRLFGGDLKQVTWKERIDSMFKRMDEENKQEMVRWLEKHGTTTAIALLDLRRMFEERDQENPGWRVQWRKRYQRDPDDMLEFFRERLRTKSDELDELGEDEVEERRESSRADEEF